MDDREYITVEYSCHHCGISGREISVTARGEEDVTSWMETCIRTVGEDHARVSPNCRAETLSDLKIPLHGDRVGGALRQ